MSLSNPCEHIKHSYETLEQWEEGVAQGNLTEAEFIKLAAIQRTIFDTLVTDEKCRLCNKNIVANVEEDTEYEMVEVNVFRGRLKFDMILHLPDEIKQRWTNKYGEEYVDILVEEDERGRVWIEADEVELTNVVVFVADCELYEYKLI